MRLAPILLLALAACAPTNEPVLTYVDLTHALSTANPNWSGSAESPFSYDTLSTQASGRPSMGRYAVPEHFSTHLDAPIHGGDNQPSVDELTADELFGPGVLIDVSSKARDPDYALTRSDIEAWETVNGRVPEGAVILMYSGWASRWTDPPSYRNADDEGMHFPGFGVAAARFLVEERSIRGIGVDTPSVDPAQADGFPVHGVVNGSGHYQLENLAIPPGLPPLGFDVIVAPVKILGGSGGQVRVWAVLDGDTPK